ncbi:CHASE3 domain-containing protein [Daejeonella sp.]|uniref:CHASE3 domain-containing protein n=1 Tax=Daejeonella sp. TaxID=2805397 RepID=UPI003C752132
MKKSTLEIRIEICAFIAAVLILIALSINSYNLFNKHLKNTNSVQQAYQIQAVNNSLLATLKDADSSQKGFIITADERYLDSFHGALQRYDTSLNSLLGLTLDNQGQYRRIQSIKTLAKDGTYPGVYKRCKTRTGCSYFRC